MFLPNNRSNLLQINRFLLPLAILASGILAVAAYGNPFGRTAVPSLAAPAFGGSPSSLAFIPSSGIGDPAVQYTLRQPGATTYFTADSVRFSWVDGDGDSASLETVGLRFLGAGAAAVQGENLLPGVVNYLHGSDPAEWRTRIPTYEGVVYESLYPGVDLTYSGDGGNLNILFQVETTQALSHIEWQFDGAAAEIEAESGTLVVRPEGGDSYLQLRRPQLWQTINGKEVPLALSYIVGADGRIGLQASEPLADGPAAVSASMLLPGLGAQDYSEDIAIDDAGNIYVTGHTTSVDFPVENPAQNYGGIWDVFVSKFSPDGSTLLYSTYLGGQENDWGGALTVDGNGVAYVTGDTSSDNFPTMNPYQAALNGTSDVFITRLSADGSTLLYSTYFGGSWGESGADIVSKDNYLYLTGVTLSNDFPTQNPLQPTIGGTFDTFFTKLEPSTNTLVFSSYLGGDFDDFVGGMTVDANDNILLVGQTGSSNFPMVNPIQPIYHGNWDMYFTGITADGGSYLFSTFFGGSYHEGAGAVEVDSSGNIHIGGTSFSNDFPVTIPGNPLWQDAVLVTLSPDGGTLLSSVMFGGNDNDGLSGMVMDESGNKYLTGITESPDFPLQHPVQSTLSGAFDIFVTKLDSNNTVLFSTYLGGDESDNAAGIAVDSAQQIYVAGDTFSLNFPTVNAFQPGYAGGAGDVVVAKFDSVDYVMDFSTYFGGGPYPGNPTAVSLTEFDGRSAPFNVYLYLAAALLLIFLLGSLFIYHKKRPHEQN